MENYKKKYLTGKISKIDKELKYLDNLVPNGIVKDCLKDEMTSKKKSFSKMFTQNVKRQKILNQPKTQDQKVNAISQYICLKMLQRSCMRSLSHNYVYKMPDKIAQNILLPCTMLSNIDDPTATSWPCLHLLWSLIVNKHPLTKVQLAKSGFQFLGGISENFNLLAGNIPQFFNRSGLIWKQISGSTTLKLFCFKPMGYCFLNSVLTCLLHDYGDTLTLEDCITKNCDTFAPEP